TGHAGSALPMCPKAPPSVCARGPIEGGRSSGYKGPAPAGHFPPPSAEDRHVTVSSEAVTVDRLGLEQVVVGAFRGRFPRHGAAVPHLVGAFDLVHLLPPAVVQGQVHPLDTPDRELQHIVLAIA